MPMDLRVNAEKVEQVLAAFVHAATNNPYELEDLLRVLRVEGLESGLGYIINNAILSIEKRKRESETTVPIRHLPLQPDVYPNRKV